MALGRGSACAGFGRRGDALGLSALALLKYLRIAVTALSITACMLLIALWVRSGNYIDRVTWHYSKPWAIKIGTTPGRILILKFVDKPIRCPGASDVKLGYFGRSRCIACIFSMPARGFGALAQCQAKTSAGVYVPFWSLVVLATVFALAPWLKWFRNFSLRTLLIATTLVAVGLGILVWSS